MTSTRRPSTYQGEKYCAALLYAST